MAQEGETQMRLCDAELKNKAKWEEKGYHLPKFDKEKVEAATKENPVWIHFGAGNIFRAFLANAAQNMLNEGAMDRGLVIAQSAESVEKLYRPHDHNTLLVTLKADGTIEKTVVGSVMESCILDAENEVEFGRLREIFTKESLQMASFTITEKGYALVDGNGKLLPAVAADYKEGPAKPKSYMGKVAALLYARYQAGGTPIAMVSMDNCSHNGDKLRTAVNAMAEKWTENKLVEEGFQDYVSSQDKVAFPWTMIDKITPRPDDSIKKILQEDGVEDMEPIVTKRGSFLAPFVNAEESEYLVIEDTFPNGRPALEKGGFMLTDRETVDKVERMKVCTCLNPLHTALAVFGCLLNSKRICDEMKDPQLSILVETLGRKEGMPVVTDPGIIDPEEFLDTALKVRLANPFMPDTPQRIAMDTSQKLAIRFGETIKAYQASDHLDVEDLKMIPLVIAGWLRYLMGVDDEGNAFEVSPDPMLDILRPYISKLRLGEDQDVESIVAPILRAETIFGVDLYEAGLAGKICGYLVQMTQGPGAVRATLKKYCK